MSSIAPSRGKPVGSTRALRGRSVAERLTRWAGRAGACAFALAACDRAESLPEAAPVHGRPDLALLSTNVEVNAGRAQTVEFVIGPGTGAVLIEVRGARGGFYFLEEFVPPSGQDVVGPGLFTTREAREVEGLADFLFPNDARNSAEPGTYGLSLSAFRDRDGTELLDADNLEIRVYVEGRPRTEPCGLHLDFLVDEAAIDIASFEAAVDDLVARVDTALQRVGISVVDFQIQRIDLTDSDVNVGDRSALEVADDVLAQARARGSARRNSVHVLLVRSIAGQDASGFNPAGYSMGLPGPYDADRPNATVLAATEVYAQHVAGELVLDVAGMSTSLAHEIGHFLGLYHTSESSGSEHDPLSDTPECSSPDSCRPAFRRNLMTAAFWLTEAGLDPATRSEFSVEQGLVMRGHPLCVPLTSDNAPTVPPPRGCELECDPPTTCATTAEVERCAVACDPQSSTPCDEGTCQADDRGTFVCA